MLKYVVCGWYTPDYEHWFRALEASLLWHGAPYDFVAVPKFAGGWEHNTCRKAGFVIDALNRHPGRVVIFLDVDCVVTGDLGQLVGLPCDTAVDFHISKKKRRVNLVPATGHMVLNPTPKTRELMAAWALASENPEFGLNDQETLTLAMAGVEDLTLMRIGKTARGTLIHDCASAAPGVQKVTGRQRFIHKMLTAVNML